MDKRIILVIGIVLLAAITFVVLQKFVFNEKGKLVFVINNVANDRTVVDHEIEFVDQTLNATSWKWNFGDDQYGFEKNVKHVYTKAGRYKIKVTVEGPFGTLTDSSKVLTVEMPVMRDTTIKEVIKPKQIDSPKVVKAPVKPEAHPVSAAPSPKSPKPTKPIHKSTLPKAEKINTVHNDYERIQK